jgi:DNA-directed RNA polymerase subunit F
MKLIKENIPFLQAVAKLPKKQAKELLSNANRQQILSIAEVSKNVLARIIQLQPDYKGALKRRKLVIRNLADKELSHKERAEIVVNSSDTVVLLIRAVLKRLIGLTGK